MSLKPGDKVRVKRMQELAARHGKPHHGICGATIVVPGGMNFTSAMEPCGGKVFTIRSKSKLGYYLEGHDGLAGDYCFTEAMLDKVIGRTA